VRNTEGLVEVEVGDIATDISIAGEAHQGVEVGAIDIYLAASIVNCPGNVADSCLVHPVGRGVSDHQRS
jgi:hypothetical protein